MTKILSNQIILTSLYYYKVFFQSKNINIHDQKIVINII